MNDLDQEELEIHQLLSAVKPASLPLGFREAVMHRVREEGAATRWEWIFAAILAVPSLAYLGLRIASNGSELGASVSAILVAAQGLDATTGAIISIDGLAIVSLALVGVGSVVAAHAMLRGAEPRRLIAR